MEPLQVEDIDVEPIQPQPQILVGPTIVAHDTPDIDHDWTSHFSTKMVRHLLINMHIRVELFIHF